MANTPTTTAVIPPELRDLVREQNPGYTLAALIRAGLLILSGTSPEDALKTESRGMGRVYEVPEPTQQFKMPRLT